MLDLHLHLDGSLSLDSVKKLAKINKIKLPDDDREILGFMQVSDNCKNLNEYLEKFDFAVSLLQTEECLKTAAYDLCKTLKEQGLVYAEIRFAPQKHTDKGLNQSQAVKAVLDGITESKFPCGLILCCMRGDGNREENLLTVKVAKEFYGKGVCAIDLAGAEALFSTENFENIFAEARKLGIPFTIHAGEADGPQSIKKAIEFGAKRIGHGVRATEDKEIIDLLVKTQIPLEVCVKSNIDTRIFESIENHSIKNLIDWGVNVTVNTDNMTVSAVTLKDEFISIKNAFDLTDNDLKKLVLNAADAAFTSDENKSILKEQIENRFKSFSDKNADVISHYDMMIDENNDPFRDPPILKEYMNKWDGQIFVKSLKLDKKKKVLEVGIGTGRIAEKIAPYCLTLTGIDISPKTVKRAKENLKDYHNISFICDDFNTYRFEETFDVIYSSLTMMHFENKKDVISKIDKLLNKDGIFCISIDKDQSEYIDMQTRKIKIYPDTCENIILCIKETDMTVVDVFETENAYIIVSNK